MIHTLLWRTQAPLKREVSSLDWEGGGITERQSASLAHVSPWVYPDKEVGLRGERGRSQWVSSSYFRSKKGETL